MKKKKKKEEKQPAVNEHALEKRYKSAANDIHSIIDIF